MSQYYNRPSGAPPGYNSTSTNGYSRPSGSPPSQSSGNSSSQGYSRPSGAPPDHSNDSSSSSHGHSRPSGAPPPHQRLEETQVFTGETSSYNQGGITYQRPSGPPPLPHNGRYQSQDGSTKKALLIGINYIGTDNALRGCINDAKNMRNFLIKNRYPAENIVLLSDDQTESVKIPTRANILRAMNWLVKDAKAGDCLFFHYSGHGGQEEDSDGDEVDGYDDCIYPLDFKTNGSLIDDVMHDTMVKPLVKGVRLTCIFDSCHSGSALDLPYAYRAQDGGIKEYNIWKESQDDALNIVKAYSTDNYSAMLSSATSVFKRFQASSSVDQEKILKEKSSEADVIMFSGCKDSQTSADASEAGTFTGALSWSFLEVLNQDSTQSYLTLLQNIRSVLATKYTQKPQLSSSHEIDPNIKFVL